MNLGIPQVIYIIMVVIALMVAANEHGTMSTRPKSVWRTLIAISIQIGIMAWGGFFTN